MKEILVSNCGYPFASHNRGLTDTLQAAVENPRGSVGKLSPKESVGGTNTVQMCSVRAPKEFSEGKPEVLQPRACHKKSNSTVAQTTKTMRFTAVCSQSSHCPLAQCEESHIP